jgi:hypothetical protein
MCASVRRFSGSGEALRCCLAHAGRGPDLARHSPDRNPCLRSEPPQQPEHRRFRHRDTPRRRRKILARQMQEYRAAATGDARRGVVIDLDNEIVEVIVALEPIAAAIAIQPYRPVVVAAVRVLAPGILRPDGASRQEGLRPRMPVGAPPQSPRPEAAFRGPAVAFALVGDDSPASQCDRDGLPAGCKPAPAGIAGGSADPDRGQRPITSFCSVSS